MKYLFLVLALIGVPVLAQPSDVQQTARAMTDVLNRLPSRGKMVQGHFCELRHGQEISPDNVSLTSIWVELAKSERSGRLIGAPLTVELRVDGGETVSARMTERLFELNSGDKQVTLFTLRNSVSVEVGRGAALVRCWFTPPHHTQRP